MYDRVLLPTDGSDEALDEIERRARSRGIEAVRTEVITGSPHRAIREYAEDKDVDLIVIGTHGRTGVERYLLGSVTEKIVRTADVPVLTVRPEE
jgi:nucleotide-binding universal stress UspA family protein